MSRYNLNDLSPLNLAHELKHQIFADERTFKTDIVENYTEYLITAEFPGFSKKDISIDYQDDILTISATRKREERSDKDELIRSERSYGNLSRQFYLEDGDVDQISAKFENGLLTITIPKRPRSAKGNIQID